ncbi:MAG: hypothetical protein ACRD7E_08105 [Bryobacteraceae bacterium]
MRRLKPLAALLAGLLLTGACRRTEPIETLETDESPPQLLSMVHVADPRSAVQLLKGFHEIEQNSWRWTMGEFAVVLKRPGGAAEDGASLQMKISVPDVLIDRLGPVTLSAEVNGAALEPESYKTAGEFTYTRSLPASMLTEEAVPVRFVLDKHLPPSPADHRELGIIVSVIGLEPK